MKKINLLPILLAFSIPAFAADAVPFADVDQNQDGILNISEAQDALPEVEIIDTNDDGIVSKAEAETAVPGLRLSPQGQGDGSSPVGAVEYQMIVQAINDQSGDTASIN